MDFVIDREEIEFRAQIIQERKKRYEVEEKLRKLITSLTKAGINVPPVYKIESDTDSNINEEYDYLSALQDNENELGEETDEEFTTDLEESNIKLSNNVNIEDIETATEPSASITETINVTSKQDEQKIKLLEENVEELQQKISFMAQKLSTLEDENRFLSFSVVSLQKKLSTRTTQLETLVHTNQLLQNQQDLYTDLYNRNSDLEAHLELLGKSLEEEKQRSTKHLESLDKREKEYQLLKEEFTMKEETVEKMAKALIKLKTRLTKYETEMCKFVVEKIYDRYPPSSAKITVIKDMQSSPSKYQLDIVVHGKRTSRFLDQLISLDISKHDPELFSITFKDSPKEEFKSQVRSDVVQTLQELLVKSRSQASPKKKK
eukprot:TRINITY_DN4622_c0_g1_i3.p1 TRINITY_DN4622_c0_g1~~TRINITY_DN4622_c0_g1_i3.p1  ORF type:complete len:376 (+),score=64.49 TRINITY_DN4622_c0_g1_i3:7-1134(+)